MATKQSTNTQKKTTAKVPAHKKTAVQITKKQSAGKTKGSAGQSSPAPSKTSVATLKTFAVKSSEQGTTIDWIEVARLLMTSRLIDIIEETELVSAGKVTYQFSSKGHELAQILMGLHTRGGHDGAAVYYRSRPYMLAVGMTIREAFAGPMGRATGRSGGRDIGVVHSMPPRLGVTVLPASGDVGAQYTPAVGWAQAAVYRTKVLHEEAWSKSIGLAMGGDGSVATNGFWSALTIATTQSLPCVMMIEDNGFGISVTSDLQTPNGNIANNLRAFRNLYILDADGTEPEEALLAVAQAVQFARTKRRPALIRLTVPRLCGHSGADNQSYKTPEQVEAELKRDPLVRLREFMIAKKILTTSAWDELQKAVEADVRKELAVALRDNEPAGETASAYLFHDMTKVQKVGGLRAENIALPMGNIIAEQSGPRINLIEAVKRVLDEELSAHKRIVVFGEDVAVKGGVHGATVGLQAKHSNHRVFDTSLSEEGIIGRAIGMALAGLLPVPEIQFRKYLDPATEQINDCGTIRWRTNGEFSAPMVVRIPVGNGKKTADPWHSVSNEAILAHTLGWRIAMPSNARDAAGLLRSALRGNDPTFFLEHRALLDTSAGRSEYPGSDYIVPFGVASIVRPGSRATIVTWGEMVHRSVEAVEKSGLDIEVIDLRTLAPWDKDTVLKSVRKTSRCCVVHEDTITAGFGAEIAAVIAHEAFRSLDAPVLRVATKDCPMPYNPVLTHAVVPQVDDIVQTLQNLCAW